MMRCPWLGPLPTVIGFAMAVAAGAAGPEVVAGTTGAVGAVEAFHQALATGNRDASIALLDPDVVIFEEGDAEMSCDEYVSHHLAADIDFVAATKTDLVDRRSGGSADLAWVITRSRTTGTFRGRDIGSLGGETMVLRRGDNGKWRILHIHWSSRPIPKPAAKPSS
ncbi:MAG: nuclear transport factor 2 family protein [Thermoanaerobaculia bacterium]